MKILALEFSSPQRSVAILQSDAQVCEVIETGAGANAPLVIIEEALREAKLEREQIECLAVGIGPGSYTGIRAAIALAQGWRLARPIKLLGISSAECVAAQAQAEGVSGRASVVIDAQREEFYLATFELDRSGYKGLEPLQIVSRAELQRRATTGNALIGPEMTTRFSTAKNIFPRAATLGRLASSRADFIAGEKLEPIYLRETKFIKAPPARIVP